MPDDIVRKNNYEVLARYRDLKKENENYSSARASSISVSILPNLSLSLVILMTL